MYVTMDEAEVAETRGCAPRARRIDPVKDDIEPTLFLFGGDIRLVGVDSVVREVSRARALLGLDQGDTGWVAFTVTCDVRREFE